MPPWRGVRGPKSAPIEANVVVAPIHPKAMAVILTTPKEFELWLRGRRAQGPRCPLAEVRGGSSLAVRKRIGRRKPLRTPSPASGSRRCSSSPGLPFLCGCHGQGFDHYCAWLDERGYRGTDHVPHDAKVREVGAPGARTRIETLVTLGKPALVADEAVMEGVNAGRKTIPFARRQDPVRAGPGKPAGLSNRVEREGARVQEDTRPQLGLSRRGRMALPIAALACADARAGAGESADRYRPA